MATEDELQHFGAQIGESSQKSSEELKSCVGEIKDKITFWDFTFLSRGPPGLTLKKSRGDVSLF